MAGREHGVRCVTNKLEIPIWCDGLTNPKENSGGGECLWESGEFSFRHAVREYLIRNVQQKLIM